MALGGGGTFDYWLGGRPAAAATLGSGGFDYWRGGRPVAVVSGAATTYQYVYPISDVADGSWTNEVGSTTNIYASVADASDSTYARSSVTPTADVVKWGIGNPGTPGVGSWTMTIRHEKL